MVPTITAFESSPDRGAGLARDTRVRWALEEVGQPYEVRLVRGSDTFGSTANIASVQEEEKSLMKPTMTPFLNALSSESPAAELTKDMELYSWLIGSWDLDTVHTLEDGTVEKSTGEVHFGWVLEGRAIQDVWIRPKRPAPSTMYGTTWRIYDPGTKDWHIIWADPLNQDYSRQIGRAQGGDIVQIGEDLRGVKARWRFTEITADSFHWIGEERSSDDEPWRKTYEHYARRSNP